MRAVVTIRNENGDEAASIRAVKRVGDRLVMDGRALGTMEMEMILSAEDALGALKIAFSWEVISFMFLLPFYILKNRIMGKKKRAQDTMTQA